MPEETKLQIKTSAKPEASTDLSGGWRPLENLRREIDRVFEGFNLGVRRLPFARSSFDLDLPWSRDGGWAMTPAVDVAERPTEFEITAELPGMSEKDIEVRLSNGTLSIKGEKKVEREEKEKDYYVSERRYGSFTRSFALPDGVDTAKVEATFTKGVLTVKLPKTAESRQKEQKIEVKAA